MNVINFQNNFGNIYIGLIIKLLFNQFLLRTIRVLEIDSTVLILSLIFFNCTLVQTLRLRTGSSAHRGSRGLALL